MAKEKKPPSITDLDALKVFAHPLRIALYRHLKTAEAATASQLAEQVDEAVALVSYHLRKMAAHGFLVEAPELSTDGRERWWRLASDRGWSFRSSDFTGDPEGAAVVGQVTRHLLATRAERYSAYLDQQAAWPEEWTDAAFSSEYTPRLTAAELAGLGEEIAALVRRYGERGRAAEAAGDTTGREHVALHLYGFPFRSPGGTA
ncbi:MULTISPECIES: helix-turn-helix domain-containing protein [unclassified Streptomyces]|uniref:helix-turn-helix domain-containing protein n=1 Tax=unclassified Streptomyces TaxID=2593676 RepID=UPI0038043792